MYVLLVSSIILWLPKVLFEGTIYVIADPNNEFSVSMRFCSSCATMKQLSQPLTELLREIIFKGP